MYESSHCEGKFIKNVRALAVFRGEQGKGEPLERRNWRPHMFPTTYD